MKLHIISRLKDFLDKKITSIISNKYFTSSLWLLAEKLVRMILNLLIGVWIARYLGPSDFGTLSYVQSIVVIFTTLASLGLDSIVVKKLVERECKESDILGSAFFLKLFASIFILLLLFIFLYIVPNGYSFEGKILALLTFSTVFHSFNVIDFYFQSKVLGKYIAISNIIFLLTSSILKIALILIGADVFYFVVALVFDAFLLAMTFVFIFLLREGRLSLYIWRPKKSICFELLRESWPLIVSGLIVIIYMKIDQVMLMHLVGKTELGIYSAAAKVSEVWYFIPMVLANTLFPAILNAKKNTVKEYHKKLQFLYDIMVIIALFISIPMYFLSDIIVTSLYGADYASAGEVIRVYIFSLIFVFLGTASSKWFICEGLQKYSLYRTLVGLFINIGLNYILIPIYHGMGAAIATVISQIFASYLVNLFHPKLRITFFLHTNSILILLRIFGLKFKV